MNKTTQQMITIINKGSKFVTVFNVVFTDTAAGLVIVQIALLCRNAVTPTAKDKTRHNAINNTIHK